MNKENWWNDRDREKGIFFHARQPQCPPQITRGLIRNHLLLSHSLIFFRFLFYKNMVVIYVFLLEEAMYSYCYVCILIVSLRYSYLCVVYVFLDAATLTEVFL